MAIIVLIGGGSGSGKTAITRQAVRELSFCQISHMSLDNFYLPPKSMNPDDVNFDHPDAIDTRLLTGTVKQLLRDRPVTMPVFDHATHTRQTDTLTILPSCLVLIEGIHALSIPDIVEHARIKVFIDAPEDVRLRRRIERDVKERSRTPEEVRKRFENHVRPMHDAFVEPCRHTADIVIDATHSMDECVAQLTGAVLDSISREQCASCKRRRT